jgi:maltooligosyltrehalose synthase
MRSPAEGDIPMKENTIDSIGSRGNGRIARSFYRAHGMTFGEIIEDVVPYAKELGIEGIFLGPILDALSYRSPNRKDWHGYDAVSRVQISPQLGGFVQFNRLMQVCRKAKLKVAVDVVPNHDSDQNPDYQSGAKTYDWYEGTDGLPRCGNFFGLGWLPRLFLQDRQVFLSTQSFTMALVAQFGDVIKVLRRDHSDGLAYPKEVARWTTEFLASLGCGAKIIDEKIIQLDEDLASDTGTQGETGYKPLTMGNLVSHNGAGVEMIRAFWQEKTGNKLTDKEAAAQAKYEAALQHFPSDLVRVCASLNTLADKIGEDHINVDQLARMLADMPVYRIYPEPGKALSQADCEVLAQTSLPDWYKKGLTIGDPEVVRAAEPIYALMSAIFAKGVEDRMFYRQTPLLSLRDVGGAMDWSSMSVADYHVRMERWSRLNPETWATTDTHDSKRSLVSRSRLAACSWVPARYLAVLVALSEKAAKYKPAGLDWQVEDFVYQTLISSWPEVSLERLLSKPSGEIGYFVKAFREKCAETSWFHNNQQFEQEVEHFVSAICTDRDFLDVMEPFCKTVSQIGLNLALNQQLLKLFASPVADFYHGAEGTDNVWLVDPDNRLPQDYKKLRRLLTGIRFGAKVTDQTKMLKLVWTVLQARKRFAKAMDSAYEVIEVGPGKLGIKRGRLVAVMAIDPEVGDVSNDGPKGEILLSYGRQVVKVVA